MLSHRSDANMVQVDIHHTRWTAIMSVLSWIYVLFICASAELSNGPNDAQVVGDSEEQRLISNLLSHYESNGKITRPVTNNRDSVQVMFGIRLVHLDLDEKDQVMKTSVWVRTTWMDERAKWDPMKYNYITTIVMPADRIWVPDIALVNTADTTFVEKEADVIVKFDGRIYWAPHRKYSSACLINVTEYPYDLHTCDMWFQSMSYHGGHLNVTAYYTSPLDLTTYLNSYKEAQEWTIISNESIWYERPRDVGTILMWSRRPSLKFSLTVQRRPGFSVILLIVPCALLSFLVPLVFCLPPQRPDRHSISMSLFSSLTILLFMVNEVAPPSASFVPRLTLYYCFNLLILLVATCCSVSVVNISKRGETRERVPKAVKLVFIKGIGRVLCFGERLNHLSEVKRASKHMRSFEEDGTRNDHENSDSINQMTTSNHQSPSQSSVDMNASLLLKMCRQLSSIETRMHDRKSDKKPLSTPSMNIPADIGAEWYTLSMVLDRLFFYLFLLANLVSFSLFYPRSE